VSYDHKHYDVDGYSCDVYDNLFNRSLRDKFYNFVIRSYFQPSATDTLFIEHRHHISMASVYDRDDLMKLGLWDAIPEEIKTKHNMDLDHLTHTLINLTTPGDVHHSHTDNYDSRNLTVLYYVNPEWNVEWGGDTLFLDQETENIEFASQFKPGRLVVFDPRIPHLIRPSTTLAPQYRFSIALKFEYPNE